MDREDARRLESTWLVRVSVFNPYLVIQLCVPMDFTGRPMRGFVFVEPEGTASAATLRSWVSLALEFNPRAQASRRAKPKPTGKKS